jgi:hypothetical protein
MSSEVDKDYAQERAADEEEGADDELIRRGERMELVQVVLTTEVQLLM